MAPVMIVLLCFLAIFSLIAVFLVMEYFLTSTPKRVLSPYTKKPVWKAIFLPRATMLKVANFLFDIHQYDNRPFPFRKAVFCRETGRIFQDAINWRGKTQLDWTFITKRYPGHYVSWGSLSDLQQDTILRRHGDVSAFQTSFSSTKPNPNEIEPVFVECKPGPLYVDIDTHVLVGWQEVPDTFLEVLIVQKPIR